MARNRVEKLEDEVMISKAASNVNQAVREGARTGTSSDPRPVIAKFLYRPERLQVTQNKRSLKNDVLIRLENTIGTISSFLFAINHRKLSSKRQLKNIILLNIDLRACVCAWATDRIKSILLKCHN